MFYEIKKHILRSCRFVVEVTFNQLKSNARKSYSICMLIEHLEGIRNASYFVLFSFAEGLVKWNVSGSKALHSLDSCSRACGSVATMKNFFKEKGTVPNSCVMAEDIEIFADNTKRKGRTSRVKEDVTRPIGILLMLLLFNLILKVLFNKISGCYLRTGYIILILMKPFVIKLRN